MILTTQIKDPGHSHTWIPCQEHQRVTHPPVKISDYDAVIASHWLCWDYWDQKVKDIGGVREIITVGSAEKFENLGMIARSYKTATDIPILENRRYLWLRGNGAFRDFSVYPNVTELQTHQTQVNPGLCNRVLNSKPQTLYVYSNRVLKYFETKGGMIDCDLYHVPSCTPNPTLWHSTVEFYPGEEAWRGTI